MKQITLNTTIAFITGFLILFYAPHQLHAQVRYKKKSKADQRLSLKTNIFSYDENYSPTFSLEFWPSPNFSLSLGGTFVQKEADFDLVSGSISGTSFSPEIRIYPFGHLFKGPQNITPRQRRIRKKGGLITCNELYELSKFLARRIFMGAYIGTWYNSQNYDLEATATIDSQTYTYEHTFQGKSYGASLGYQIRLWRLNLDAGYRLGMGRDLITGPNPDLIQPDHNVYKWFYYPYVGVGFAL